LWASNGSPRGATFHISLPVLRESDLEVPVG
jgi:hypothetical protein